MVRRWVHWQPRGHRLGVKLEQIVTVTFDQGVLFSTSRELWFGRQLWLGARLRPGGLGGGEMKESESFITTIVCLVGILLSVLDTALW